MIKAAAINGSPEMENGLTEKILAPFLEGMREGGAEVETFYVSRLRIKACTGKMWCWYKTPGKCYIRDDMQSLYPRLRESDILVLATPVYVPLPGAMQNFINRLCPFIEPSLTWRDGRTRARFGEGVKVSKIVLVATGGWWEVENLDTVVRIASELAEDASVEFVGALLRPHAFLMEENPDKAQRIEQAAKAAGHELVVEGSISPDLLQRISQPLIAEEDLRRRYNEALRRAKGLPDEG